MKFSQPSFVTIILVIMAIFFAGCTASAPAASPAATPKVTADLTTTSGTPVSSTAGNMTEHITQETTPSPASIRVFAGNYHWVEYRENNTVTMPPNPRFQWEFAVRVERSPENYNGSPAIHYKITTTSDYPEWIGDILVNTKNGRIDVEDSYYEASTDRVLGKTMTETIKGEMKPAVDYTAYLSGYHHEDSPGGYLGIDPFGEMNVSLNFLGIESVKVPAGTYPGARKYSGNFRDGTPITFWVVPGIPVPVQYQFPNKYMDGVDPFQSYELKGWG